MLLFFIPLYLLFFLLCFFFFYFLAVYLLKFLPVNRQAEPLKEGIELMVMSNGAHTDICLPISNQLIDWTKFVDLADFKPGKHQYISFGWGDKGFYFDTPTWAELKFSTAFKAICKLSQSTIQVVLYEEEPANFKWFKKMYISEEEYLKVVSYVKASFDYDKKDQIIKIDFAGLPAYEQMNYKFYEAQGQYHIFKTCNCWANDALKIAGIKTAVWAPFAKAVFYHLNKEDNTEEMLSESMESALIPNPINIKK